LTGESASTRKKQKDGEEIDVLTAAHLGQGHVEGTPS